MVRANPADSIQGRFLLQPEITAEAQEIFFRLSQSPAGCAIYELVELVRERMIWMEAQRSLFDRTYVSKRQIDLEARAHELEKEGRRCWALQMKHRARKHWQQADKLWRQVDEISRNEKMSLRSLDRAA